MKYSIGIEIPKNYKSDVGVIRHKFKNKLSEPHINIITSKFLPNDDSFISKLIELCSTISPFCVKTKEINIYKKSLIYQHIESKRLIEIRNTIAKALDISLPKYYNSYYTIYAKNFISTPKLNVLKELSTTCLKSDYVYTVHSIIVYKENKLSGLYDTFMKINLD